MIVLAGLGIESGSLFVHEEGADLSLLNETVKVAINGGETDPRQFFVNPPVDLMGERVGVIALEGFEHLLQLPCCAFARRSPHRVPRILGYRTERTSVAAKYQIAGLLSSTSQLERRWDEGTINAICALALGQWAAGHLRA
jgi:hypothetical protein